MKPRSAVSQTKDVSESRERRVLARWKPCVQSIVPSKCAGFPNGVCQNVHQDGAPPSLLLSEKAGTADATSWRENGIPIAQANEDGCRKQRYGDQGVCGAEGLCGTNDARAEDVITEAQSTCWPVGLNLRRRHCRSSK